MKTILSIITSILLTSVMYGQYETEDRVIMLNDAIHEGIIIEQKPGEHIKLLRLPEKDTLTLAMESIDRLEKIIRERSSLNHSETSRELINTDNPTVLKKPAIPAAPSPPTAPSVPGVPDAPVAPETPPVPEMPDEPGGTFTAKYNSKAAYIMLHGLLGGGDYAYQGFGLSAGKNVGDDWQVGLSIHYMGQTSDNAIPQRQTFPLAVDIRRTIKRSKNSRFSALLSVSSGYNFTVNGDYFSEKYMTQAKIGNGLYFNPALAFRFNTTKNTGLMLDLGYQLTTGGLADAQTNDRLESLSWSSFLVRGSFFF